MRVHPTDGALALFYEDVSERRCGDGAHPRCVGGVEAGAFDAAQLPQGRDVTEERAQNARWALAQRMERIGQLTGGMAHDFNNLLTVIGGSAEVLHQRLDGHEFERRLAATIVAASDRGAKLIHSMLAFARQQPLDPRPVDAGELLDQMRILVERTLGESVELTFSAPEDERFVTFVDPHQLESALLNLILNARDAMPDGGQLTVEVGRTVLDPAYAEAHDEVAPSSYVVFAVSDTGVGIAPEQLPRVFEPFYTTKAHGAGSGLGLAMVFGFAKQSRGHVAVYSEVGHGTTVRLFVPAHRLAEAAPPRSSQAVGDDLRGHETIVVVEDDAMVRAFAAEQLRDLGYDVHEAAYGAEALAHLGALAQVDLLFTDVVMPGRGVRGRRGRVPVRSGAGGAVGGAGGRGDEAGRLDTRAPADLLGPPAPQSVDAARRYEISR